MTMQIANTTLSPKLLSVPTVVDRTTPRDVVTGADATETVGAVAQRAALFLSPAPRHKGQGIEPRAARPPVPRSWVEEEKRIAEAMQNIPMPTEILVGGDQADPRTVKTSKLLASRSTESLALQGVMRWIAATSLRDRRMLEHVVSDRGSFTGAWPFAIPGKDAEPLTIATSARENRKYFGTYLEGVKKFDLEPHFIKLSNLGGGVVVATFNATLQQDPGPPEGIPLLCSFVLGRVRKHGKEYFEMLSDHVSINPAPPPR